MNDPYLRHVREPDDDLVVQTMAALLCQNRFEDVKRQVRRTLPHVDRYVVVDNGSTDGTLEWLRYLAATDSTLTLIERRWNDSFAEARNTYLAVAERMSMEWPDRPVLIAAADDDELYSDDLLLDLRAIGKWAALEDLNVLLPLSMNADLDWKGDPVAEWRGGYYKPLLFVWEPGMRYEDHPGHFHEDMKIPSGWRRAHIDDEGGLYAYRHVKRFGETWLRATRNAFAGGGGPNLGERCPLWMPFRRMVEKLTGIRTSDKFSEYLRAGDIHPEIKDHFVRHRHIGTPLDPTPPMWAEWPDGTSEWREQFLAYFVYLNPREMPQDVLVHDRERGIRYEHDCLTIHGPDAPQWARGSPQGMDSPKDLVVRPS